MKVEGAGAQTACGSRFFFLLIITVSPALHGKLTSTIEDQRLCSTTRCAWVAVFQDLCSVRGRVFEWLFTPEYGLFENKLSLYLEIVWNRFCLFFHPDTAWLTDFLMKMHSLLSQTIKTSSHQREGGRDRDKCSQAFAPLCTCAYDKSQHWKWWPVLEFNVLM